METSQLNKSFSCQISGSAAQVVLDSMSEGFIGLSHDFTIQYFNAQAESWLKRCRQELLGRALFDAFPEARGSIFEEKYRQALREKRVLEFEAFFECEPYRNWYRVRAVPVEDGLAVFFAVISGEVETQTNLDREARLNAAIASLTEALITFDTDISRISILFLEQAKKIAGAEHGFVGSLNQDDGRFVAHSLTEIMDTCLVDGKGVDFSPDPGGGFPGLWGRCLNSKTAFFTNDPSFRHRSRRVPPGHIRIKNFLGVPAMSEDRVYGMIALANAPGGFSRNDLDSIRKLGRLYALALKQRELRDMIAASEERHRVLFKHSPDACYINDLTGALVEGNAAAEKLTGYASAEMAGKNMLEIGLLPRRYLARAAENLQKNKVGQGSGPDEFQLRTKAGCLVDVEVCTHVVVLDGKKMVLGVARDISERKRFQRELEQQREMLQTIFDSIPVMLALNEPGQGFLLSNKEIERTLGWTDEDIRRRDLLALCFPDKRDRSAVVDFIRQAPNGKWMDQMIHTRSGSFIETTWTNVPLSDGKRIGIGLDISKIRRAERALNESERKYRHLIESLDEGVWAFNLEGKTTFVNSRLCAMLVYAPDAMMGRGVIDFMDEKGIAAAAGFLDSFGRENCLEEQLELLRSDGARVFVRFALTVMRDETGEPAGLLAAVTDITERWIMQRVLESSERKYRTLFETMNQGVVYQNEAGEIVAANRAALEILDMSLEQLQRSKLMTPDDAIHEDGAPFSHDEHPSVAALHSGQRIENSVMGIKRADKSRRWVMISATPQFRAREIRPFQVYTTFTDITALKNAEISVRAYERAIESFQDAIVSIDRRYRYLLVNRAFLERYGLSREAVIGRPASHILGEEVFQEIKPHIDECLEGRMIEYEMQRTYPGLGERFLSITYHPIARAGEECLGVTAILRDVTEAKRAQEELQKTARLESLGILAGGIAHDFNNLLGGLYGYIDMAREYGSPGPDILGYLDKAMGSYHRARDLTRQLLTFSKGGAPCKKVMSIEAVVKDAAMLALSGSRIQPRFHAERNVWPANIDEGQIGQVINNLVLNARQAFAPDDEALLCITIQNDSITDTGGKNLASGDYVHVSISDNGPGIPPEALPKIFDPFFSTKQSGSGLGLATSFSIVKQHGGHIDVTSTPADGTTFDVYLPAAPDRRPATVEEPKRGATPGKGRILVMDDEETIREMLNDMLESLGYSPTVTRDGREAIERFRQARADGRPYDAAILDLTVTGGMGGKAAVRELIDIDPNVIAIVSSGYGDDPVLARPAEYGFKGIVLKPYKLADLAGALKQALAGASDHR